MSQRATEQRPSLTLRRQFKAAPEKVYAAWTDPAMIARWFGPDGGLDRGSETTAEADVRKGGRYSFVFHTADGERHNSHGEYLEVEPNRKLVFTWEWITMPERRSKVTLTFLPKDGGTLFTLFHDQFFDEAARDNHEQGWTRCLDALSKFLEA